MRARFAVGCFERVACWNGHSRSLVGTPCGIDAAPGSRIEMGMQAALFGLSAGWQVRPHLFTGVRQQFEPDDIDRCGALLHRCALLHGSFAATEARGACCCCCIAVVTGVVPRLACSLPATHCPALSGLQV